MSSFSLEGCLGITTKSGDRFDMSGVGFWWNRRPLFKPHEETKAPFAAAQETETLHFWTGLMGHGLRGVWCNPYDAHLVSKNKLRQLFIARECGLKVPETLWSNDPAEIVQFWESHGRRAVIKMFEGTEKVWQPTRAITPEMVSAPAHFRFSPSIVQEYVDGEREYRITLFGEHVFAAETRVGASRYEFDTRIDTKTERQKHTADGRLVDGLRAFMSRVGLRYAAFDIREDARGQPVFLEVNPMGQFLYLDRCHGGEILRAFCSFIEQHVRAAPGPVPVSDVAIVKPVSPWSGGTAQPYFEALGKWVTHLT